MFIGPWARNNTKPFNHFSRERVRKETVKKTRENTVDFHSTSLTDRNPNKRQ